MAPPELLRTDEPARRGDHSPTGEPAERFVVLYHAHFDAVLGYALRRTTSPADAADVVSETFLVAWRRLGHVPDEPGTLPWLYGVARRQLANHRRSDVRRRRLGQRLRHELPLVLPDVSDQVVADETVNAAMSRLSGRDEEVLRLHLWEGLESREIAQVLGLPTGVVRPRLSRARARLRELLGNDPPPSGHNQDRQRSPIREECR